MIQRARSAFLFVEVAGCLATSVVLIIAGVGKLLEIAFDLNAFTQWSSAVIALSVLEVWVGLNLLLIGRGLNLSLAWLVGVLLGAGFLGNYTIRLFSGALTDCKCLGYFSVESMSPGLILLPYFVGLALSYRLCFSVDKLKQAVAAFWRNFLVEMGVLIGGFVLLNFALMSSVGRSAFGLPRVSLVRFVDGFGDEAGLADIGTVFAGNEYSHVFRLKNFGDTDVDVLGSWVSCGCTIVTLKPQSLRAGETLSLPIIFKAPTIPGLTEARVRIFIGRENRDWVEARLICDVSSDGS